MKRLLFIVTPLFLCFHSFGQDYFEDVKGDGTPITFLKRTIFSTRINVGDNSIKANYYHNWVVDEKDFDNRGFPRIKTNLGWGLSFKTKTEDKLGSLFESGNFNSAFSGGGYFVVSQNRRVPTPTGDLDKHWALIAFFSIKTGQYQLYNPANSFDEQLSDTLFVGPTAGISFVNTIPLGSDNWYWGGSLSVNLVNNYNKLDKVEIKNDTSYSNSGNNRSIKTINDNGDIYGKGDYKEYVNVKIRGNIAYDPGILDHKIAFLFYPSVDLSAEYDPKLNLGFGINFLEKGSPTNSIVSVFFEVNDMSNSAKSTKPFIKRSFSVGVSAALNVLTGTNQ